jgi:hypothetical protein
MNPVTLKTSVRAFALALGTLTMALASARAQTIYSHTFSGSGAALNGTAVTVGGQNWQAGPAFLDNGAVNTVVGSAIGNAAFLPFTPVSGNIYQADATIVNPFGDWIGFGFFSALPVNGGDWTLSTFGQRHSNSGYGWILDRANASAADQQAFGGYGTGNALGAVNGDLFNAALPLNVSIILNTTAPTWTAEFVLNGTSYGTANLTISGPAGTIGGIGFSRTSNGSAGTGGTISSFSLVQVPEPSSFAILLVGGIGSLVAVRRKQCR